jgi:hypothetical protein
VVDPARWDCEMWGGMRRRRSPHGQAKQSWENRDSTTPGLEPARNKLRGEVSEGRKLCFLTCVSIRIT